MRKYIRHPTEIPIECSISETTRPKKRPLNNISTGGLCFRSDNSLKNGTEVMIHIPFIKPKFMVQGMVIWCHRKNDNYDVGVKFMDPASEFRVRNVEQVCYIEQYRREELQKKGRRISAEEAAREWVAKYARDFPS
jgi:hypothetical protein